MTQFVDFAAGEGTTRLTKVRNAVKNDGQVYDVRVDYWKQLREAAVQEFKTGWSGSKSLDALGNATNNPKRVENYAECVAGFKKWTKGTAFGLARKHSKVWDAHGLTVRVNPELLLTVDGQLTLIKFYLGKDPLSKPKIRTMLHLLDVSHKASSPAILDARRGRLITPGAPLADLDILLDAEAAQFMAMWNNFTSK